MNVGTLKTLAYLSSVGLLGGMVYVGYEYFTKEMKVMAETNCTEHTLAVLNDVKAPEPPRIVGLDYQRTVLPAVRDFDWTGAPPPPPPPPVDTSETAEPVKNVIPVSDIAMVLAVLGDADDEAASFALLDFKQNGAGGRPIPPGYYYVGDSLPQPFEEISIFAIRDAGVEFSFADEEREREFLEPPSRMGTGLIDVLDSMDQVRRPKDLRLDAGLAASASDTPSAPDITVRENGQYKLGRDSARQFAEDYQRILTEDVRLETYRDPATGKKAGIKVSSVKQGSIATQHGAMEGDIILSINGTSVTSEQQAIQYVKSNSDNTRIWRVEYLRAGTRRTEVYHSPQD